MIQVSLVPLLEASQVLVAGLIESFGLDDARLEVVLPGLTERSEVKNLSVCDEEVTVGNELVEQLDNVPKWLLQSRKQK